MKIKVNGKIEDVRLPKKFKEKWVKALRSGKYKQGGGQLYNELDNSYCCLGVACFIVNKKNPPSSGYIHSCKSYSDKIDKLLIGESPVAIKLSVFNDQEKSFKWIASYIEKYL